MGENTTREQKYAEVVIEVLELDVRRAHDRMVADEVAGRFMALADAEQLQLQADLDLANMEAKAAEDAIARVEALADDWDRVIIGSAAAANIRAALDGTTTTS